MTGRVVPGFTCAKGHRWTKANTRYDHRGDRFCRTCATDRQRAYREANRAKINAAALDKARRSLAPDDPRHGTPNGYTYWGCRERCCTDAVAAVKAKEVEARRRRAEVAELDRRASRSVAAWSLDEKAERRFGLDRVMVGSVWDDPTADEALEDVG